MHMVVLKVISVVQVLLGIVDAVLAVLKEPVQVPAPLVVKCARNLKGNAFIVVNIAKECVIIFNIRFLLTCRTCRF